MKDFDDRITTPPGRLDDQLPEEEIRRLKALRLLHELRVTFGMDELAREFLHSYVSRFQTPPQQDYDLITERVIYRFPRRRLGD